MKRELPLELKRRVPGPRPRLWRAAPLAVAAAGLLSACASHTYRAPVEDRSPVRPAVSGPTVAAVPGSAASAPGAAASAPPAAATSVPPGGGSPTPESPARAVADPPPGGYVVKPGDTLVRIGLETGQNWRDIARWNNIDNPNVLEVGQVLRVIPPSSEAGAATPRPVAPAPRIETRPLDARAPAASSPGAAGGAAAAASTPQAAGAGASAPSTPASATAPASSPPSAAATREGDADIAWAWPANGPVTTGFDDVRSKGVSISGKAGDPVLAAADGRVVYAGSGLRGYGNLVIVKHNPTYLTAYAHNQALLVKEDQVVRRGQKIAEMGSSDTDRVQLHFEVRRLGKPIDPAKVLPPR